MSQIVWKGKPFKSLSFGKNFEKAGRNFSGKITIFHRGGGSKKLYRRVDYERKNGARGLVERVEYDPNRTARIALIRWSDLKLDNSKTSSNLYQKKRNIFSFDFGRFVQNIQSPEINNESVSMNNSPDFFLLKHRSKQNLIQVFSESVKRTSSSKGSLHLRAFVQNESLKQTHEYPSLQSHRTQENSSKIAFSYILAWQEIQPGDEIYNFESFTSQEMFSRKNLLGTGNELSVFGQDSKTISVKQLYQKKGVSMPLHLVPLGSMIYNVELQPGRGGQLIRAAGTSGQLVKKDEMNPSDLNLPPLLDLNTSSSSCLIRMPSGQQQRLDSRCRVTIGTVSNVDHATRQLKKAGQKRWLGFRPVVRGVAMNPIDHPHGGGEGRTKGGRPSVSPWGKPSKCGSGSLRKLKRKAEGRK